MANIFAEYAKPVRSIQDFQADEDSRTLRREQLAGVQRQNALAELMAGQQRQTMADSQRSNELIRLAYGQSQGASDDVIIGSLKKTGDRGALEYATKLQEQVQKRAETEAKTRESQAKALTEVVSTVKRYATGVMANPTQQAALQAIDDMEAMHKQFGLPGNFEAQRQQVMQMQSPDQLRRWAAGHMGQADLVMTKLQQVNAGNAHVQQAVDPLTGNVVETGRTPILQSPDNAATVGASIENNQRTVSATLAGQRSVAETARLGRAQADRHFNARHDAANTGEDPTQAALNKKFGKPEAGRRWKADGSLEPIPGGSADRKTNEQQSGKETVDSVVASLRSSYDALNTGGGITSTEKGAGSNLAAAVSRSPVGQTVGGAFGTRNQKERDAIAQARPLLLQAIMKATGMSAKQMDSNAELKLYLATATDPTLSLEANREALDRLEKLYGSGATGAPAAAPGKPGKTVKRTGTSGGRKVVEYTDGSIEYAD